MIVFALPGILIIYAAIVETIRDIARWWRMRKSKQPNKPRSGGGFHF